MGSRARNGDFHDRVVTAEDHFLISERDVVLVGRPVEKGGLSVVGLREEDGRRRRQRSRSSGPTIANALG